MSLKPIYLPFLTFLAGILSTLLFSGGVAGSTSINIMDAFSFKKENKEVDVVALMKARSDEIPIETVKSAFSVHELDEELVQKIKELDFEHLIPKAIREMSRKLVGPFDTPEIDIQVAFSDNIDNDQVKVCQTSELFDKVINLSVHNDRDSDSLFMIDLDKDETNNPILQAKLCDKDESDILHIHIPISFLKDEEKKAIDTNLSYYGKGRVLLNTVIIKR